MKKITFKKIVLPLFTAVLLTSLVQAQVYEGDVELKTQSAVDAFNYTSVTGNMVCYNHFLL